MNRDERAPERTDLAEANEELRKEIAERRKIEDRLLESEAALRHALDEIKKSEAKLRQVIDTIPTLAWCNLPDGPNEFLSRRWHAYTGLPPEDSHGWGWQVAFHPDDLPPLMKKWQELLVSGEPGEIEARLRRHDGVYRWFLIRVEPLRDEAGKIVRWYGTSTDIEDHKRAEEALKASEREFGTPFIGMLRAGGIPARFDIGFPLPENKDRGEIAGYHCWAEFYSRKTGWIPVDISEAWKAKQKQNYFFGSVDANRVQFSIGRDVTLAPKQDGPAPNYFVYPYVEVDGKAYGKLEKQFGFEEVKSSQ